MGKTPALFDQLRLLPPCVLSLAAAVVGLAVGLASRCRSANLALASPAGCRSRFVVGYATAVRFLVPAIDYFGIRDCAVARDAATKNNAQYAGTQPDIMTTFDGLTADCDTRALTFNYTASGVTAADIDPQGREAVETRLTAETCGNSALRRLISAAGG